MNSCESRKFLENPYSTGSCTSTSYKGDCATEIVGADPITLHGFTQVPNFVLTQKELSVGAKLAYAMLLKYAWGDQACYPGQLKLAADMGAAERSVRTYLKELETVGILEIRQRGLGKTNLYRLHLTVPKTGKHPQSRPANFAGQHRQ